MDCVRKRSDCYEVSVCRKGKQFNKRFAYSKYGEEGALDVALKYREYLFSSNPKMKLSEYMDIQRVNNTSGKSGVYLHKHRKNNQIHFYWQARCVSPEPGKRYNCNYFSVNKYGYDVAKEKAIDARNEMLKKWEDHAFRA